MKNDDVALIRQILAGDETAFAELVKKYQKQVHVLAWRKIGDFHIAEDITQDAFLKVYQRLHTLKNPNQFSGWLYVITTNLCATWLRKNRIQTQPLEDTEITMGQRDAYSQHVVEERANTAVETQREVVKRLLAKLKESERTVMALHYLGEMTVEEISKFLGVSAGTIKSRLQRARHRLQKEETMIREALDHFQISPNLTDNIMQEVARLKPATPSGGKPLMPWIAAASSVVLIVFMLGLGSQYLARFQKPYSLDAQTETTVELVDVPIVLNLDTEPDVRNQLSNLNALGISENDGQKPDEVLLAAAETEEEDKVSVPKQEWIQSGPIKGSHVYSLHATAEDELYGTIFGLRGPEIFKLSVDGKTWQSFEGHPSPSVQGHNPPMATWNNTFYIIPNNELFASKDQGKTWNLLYSWPNDYNVIYFLQMDHVFYVAFDKGIFRSKDSGKTWKAIHDEKIKYLNSLVKVENTLFADTYRRLYRLEDDNWKPLEFPVPVRSIYTVASAENKLYVAGLFNWEEENVDHEKIDQGQERGWWIFRSTDLGDSWTDITPTNAWSIKGWPPHAKIIAIGDTLLVMERGMIRSTNGGDTWMPPQSQDTSPLMRSGNHAVALNENTFYVGSDDGLYRSTDGGKSWDMVRITQDTDRRVLYNLITSKRNEKEQEKTPTLHAIVEVGEIAKTTDNGKSWQTVQVAIPMTTPNREISPTIIQIVNSGDAVYVKGGVISAGKVGHYKVSKDGNTLVPMQDMPTFDSFKLRMHLHSAQNLSIEGLQEDFSGATQFFQQMLQFPPQQRIKLEELGVRGPFAVSGNTFYTEYNFKLFRWEPGNTEWHDIGQEETAELSVDIFKPHFIIPKLAALGDTVYYGKRDGHLVVSFDRGNNWVDLTPVLPFKVKVIEDLVFVGTTVYVATDAGIITSDNGRNWQVVTDSDGTNLIMEHLATDGTTLYGITKMTHVFQRNAIFRLENGTWNQIVTSIPDTFEMRDIITSLAVAGNTLYVSTERNGMLHFTLEE